MNQKLFLIVILLLPTISDAAQIERGVSVCPGGTCNAQEIPITTLKSDLKDSKLTEKTESTPLKYGPKKINQKQISPKKRVSTSEDGERTITLENSESNLPNYYRGIKKGSQDHGGVISDFKSKGVSLVGFELGDIFPAVIEQELEVSSQVQQPVRAFLIAGPHKGAIVYGQASLDSELKRVLITFTHIRSRDGLFSFTGTALSNSGSIGLHGEYHSQSGSFLVAEILSGLSAAALDATVQRNQNLMGGYNTAPTLENSAKIAAVSTASKATERFGQETRSAPQYTSVKPFQEIKLIVQSSAKRVD